MPHHLAILTDFPEEGWRSMDLCGDMLLDHLPREGPFAVEAARLCPPFNRLATWLPVVGQRHAAFNADRLLNRFILFPRFAGQAVRRFDLFHVADHSYGQLVHALPPGRTGVYCHDLDAFRCLFDQVAHPRPRWFRAMSQRILTGLRKAAVVFHNSEAVGDEIRRVRRSATLGRQWILVSPKEQAKLLACSRGPVALAKSYLAQNHEYADALFRLLGCEDLDAIDYSDYEGAQLIQDLNVPIPDELKERYDLVYDGGTLEHVFNFPTALRNAMEMVRLGGTLVTSGPGNNYCGHGFYQFSPELYFRVFTPDNGYMIKAVYAIECFRSRVRGSRISRGGDRERCPITSQS